jgi:hypothetical protein
MCVTTLFIKPGADAGAALLSVLWPVYPKLGQPAGRGPSFQALWLDAPQALRSL